MCIRDRSYTALNKPAFSPPGYIFPIVWTILYILMGISSYIVYSSNSPNKAKALLIYGIQLFFNFCWSILFFGFNLYLLAFIWLIALIFIIIIMIREFYAVTPLAAYLQIPYLIWCIFAAYLNLFLFIMNWSVCESQIIFIQNKSRSSVIQQRLSLLIYICIIPALPRPPRSPAG